MSSTELSTNTEANVVFSLAKLKFDFNNLDEEYISIDGQLPTMRTFKKFKVQSHGTNFQGQILIKDKQHGAINIHSEKVFGFYMENVEQMFVKYKVFVNDKRHNGSFIGEDRTLSGGSKTFGNIVQAGYSYFPKDWKTFKGVFEIQFKPKTAPISYTILGAKEMVLNSLLKTYTDCSIICQGKTFKFNKLILSSISMVFEKMFGNGYSQEASNGSVTIDDFQPDTIEAFQKTITDLLSNNGSSLETRDLTPQLLMFADKYAIAFLVDTVGNHLKSSLTMETVHEVIDVAFLTNNHDLLKVTAKFLKENLENCNDESEDWKKLQELNPKCFVLIMKYML